MHFETHPSRRPVILTGLSACQTPPHMRLLRLPGRCDSAKLRRLWQACFQMR